MVFPLSFSTTFEFQDFPHTSQERNSNISNLMAHCYRLQLSKLSSGAEKRQETLRGMIEQDQDQTGFLQSFTSTRGSSLSIFFDTKPVIICI